MVKPNDNPPEGGRDKDDRNKVADTIARYEKLIVESLFVSVSADSCGCARCKIVRDESVVSALVIAAAVKALEGRPEMLREFTKFADTMTQKYPPTR